MTVGASAGPIKNGTALDTRHALELVLQGHRGRQQPHNTPPRSPAMTLTFDLQNVNISSVWANCYSL